MKYESMKLQNKRLSACQAAINDWIGNIADLSLEQRVALTQVSDSRVDRGVKLLHDERSQRLRPLYNYFDYTPVLFAASATGSKSLADSTYRPVLQEVLDENQLAKFDEELENAMIITMPFSATDCNSN